jgi:hypothetical protein
VTIVTFAKPIDHAAAQEIGLTPLEATEVTKGYSADELKFRSVVNEKHERIGKINDFIFGKDDNIYVVLAVDESASLFSHLVAIPLRQFKLDVSPNVVLPAQAAPRSQSCRFMSAADTAPERFATLALLVGARALLPDGIDHSRGAVEKSNTN